MQRSPAPNSTPTPVSASPPSWRTPTSALGVSLSEATVTVSSPAVGALLAAVTVSLAGQASLVRISTPLRSSVKLTFTLTFLPTSSAVSV